MGMILTRRYNIDRFGYLIPHRYGNLPVLGSVATFRPGEGRFGRGAVAVEEGTTNQIFVAGYQSWFANLKVGDSIDRSVGDGTIRVTRLGEHRYRAEVIADCTYPRLSLTNTFTWPANQPHTLSAYILDYYEAPGTEGRFGLGRASHDSPRLHGANGLGRKTYTRQDTEDINSALAVRADDRLIKAGTYIEWEFAQVELNKPFATSFVDGTRPDGILAYPIALTDGYTIACYRKSHTDEDYKHVVKRSDGKVFVDGVEDGKYDVGWIGGRNLILNSTFNDNVTIYGGRGSVISRSYNKFIYQNRTGVNAGPLFVFSETLKPSTPYILSFDLKVSQDVVMNYLYLRSGMTTTNIGSAVLRLPNQNLVTGENRVEIPFTLSESSNGIWLATNIDQEVVFELSNLQLHEGTHAPHWTPAPEDLGYDGDTFMLSNQTGLVDELLILPYAASEEEIRAWYEADGPIPPHPDALLQWDWQAVRPATMVAL